MKFFLVFALFALYAVCCLNSVNALPLEDVGNVSDEDESESDEVNEIIEPTEVEELTHGLRRSKRATCDFLSAWNVNHTACATHCLLRGNKGGYCNSKATCICRK